MQIAPTTPTSPSAGPITSGMVVARATALDTGAPIDITVGSVLRTDVLDSRRAGWDLNSATHDPVHGGGSWGMVGFLRTGDAWTAVELLMPTADGPKQVWTPWAVRDVQLQPGVQMDSVWQVSHYGGDYSQHAPGWISPPR